MNVTLPDIEPVYEYVELPPMANRREACEKIMLALRDFAHALENAKREWTYLTAEEKAEVSQFIASALLK